MQAAGLQPDAAANHTPSHCFALQASSSVSGAASMPFKSFAGAVKHTYLREGLAGFYRGFGVALLGLPLGIPSILSYSIFHVGTMPAGIL